MCAGTPCTTFPLSIVRILVPSHFSSFDLRFLFEGQSRTRKAYPRKGATETTDQEGEGAEYKECQGFIDTRIQTHDRSSSVILRRLLLAASGRLVATNDRFKW